MGRLESSSSLVLDAAYGQLGPLSPLLGFTTLCAQSSSQGSLFTVSLSCLDSSFSLPSNPCSLSLFMALAIRSLFLFDSSSTYRFTFCSCAWSSLFGVIMNAQGVATCPPLNGANLLRPFMSSVTSWMSSSPIVAVKRIPNPF